MSVFKVNYLYKIIFEAQMSVYLKMRWFLRLIFCIFVYDI